MDHFIDVENISLNATFLLTVFTAGILGSGHCAAMCGPLSHLVAKSFSQNFSYNLGRFFGYATLGIIFGSLGKVLIDSDTELLQWIGSALTILFVVFSLRGMLSGRHITVLLPSGMRTKFFRFAQTQGWLAKSFYLGLLTSVLPCGWLMTFAGVAGASASAITGAAVMSVFWLSTLPVMTVVPLTANRFLQPLQSKRPILVALLVTASSFFVIGMRFYTKHACH